MCLNSIICVIYVLDVCLLTVNVDVNKPAYQQYPLSPGDDRNDGNAVDGRKSDLSLDSGQC